MKISLEDALGILKIPYTREVGYFKVLCPFHDDHTPSGNLDPERGYHCFVCKKSCAHKIYLAAATDKPLSEISKLLGIAPKDNRSALSVQEIERMHQQLQTNKELLSALHYRAVSNETIRLFRLGCSDGRITIPIQNEAGDYVNIKYYAPGNTNGPKFISLKNRYRRHDIYPYSQLDFDKIMLCGGEIKALAALERLNKEGIGALSTTAGESEWNLEVNKLLTNKIVYVCNDVDAAGIKATFTRCNALYKIARTVHAVYLKPEQVGGLEKGDINDFLRLGGDLYSLLVNTPEWVYISTNVLEDTYPVDLPFTEAFLPETIGKRTRIHAMSTGAGERAYIVPTKVVVICPRDMDICVTCGVYNKDTYSINSESSELLDFCDITKEQKEVLLKRRLGIPLICRKHILNEENTVSITNIRMEDTKNPETLAKLGYVVNSPIVPDVRAYELTGRAYADPKNQSAVYLATEIMPGEDIFDGAVDTSGLEVFNCEPTKEGIEAKLKEIYDDLEANVTRIYCRRDMHLAYDLAYHSALVVKIDDTFEKGYVELIAVGDTGQGKSKVGERLQQHYDLGVKIDCKITTVAGLTIGIDKSLNKYFAVYGAMPRNDRKLLIFEELKGMPSAVFQALTEVRTSGKVQITKIVSMTKPARVRMLAISNPIGSRSLSSYVCGIDAVQDVVGTLEDVRRFDMALLLDRRDLKPERLTEILTNPPKVPHTFTNELCYKLLKRVWSAEYAIIEDRLTLLRVQLELANKYSDGSPLLDAASCMAKVARLAAALAGRLNSFNEDKQIVVKTAHIEYIGAFLDRLYSSPAYNVQAKASNVKKANELSDGDLLLKYLNMQGDSIRIASKLLEVDILTQDEIRSIIGDYALGQTFFSKLYTHNALLRVGKNTYIKTEAFIELLKQVTGKVNYNDF